MTAVLGGNRWPPPPGTAPARSQRRPPSLPKTPLPRSPELFFLINLAAARPGCLVGVNDITDPRRGGPRRPPPPPRRTPRAATRPPTPTPRTLQDGSSPRDVSPRCPHRGGGAAPASPPRLRPAALRLRSSGQRQGARGVAGYREGAWGCGAKAVLCGGTRGRMGLRGVRGCTSRPRKRSLSPAAVPRPWRSGRWVPAAVPPPTAPSQRWEPSQSRRDPTGVAPARGPGDGRTGGGLCCGQSPPRPRRARGFHGHRRRPLRPHP